MTQPESPIEEIDLDEEASRRRPQAGHSRGVADRGDTSFCCQFSIVDLLGSCLGQKPQVWVSVRLATPDLGFFMRSCALKELALFSSRNWLSGEGL